MQPTYRENPECLSVLRCCPSPTDRPEGDRAERRKTRIENVRNVIMNSVLAARAISNLLTDRPTTMMTGRPGQNEALGRQSTSISMSCGEREGGDKAAARRPICPLRAHSLGRSIHPATATDRVRERERVHFGGRESEHCVLPASERIG